MYVLNAIFALFGLVVYVVVAVGLFLALRKATRLFK